MKNFNIYRNITLFISMVLLLGSCSEYFVPSLDSTYTRLVVDGSITTDTIAHKVTLSWSGDALNTTERRFVSGANVSISDGNTTIPLTENDTLPGVYETAPDVYGLPGHTYQLTISNVDVDGDGVKEVYTASSLLKAINPVDTITLVYQKYSSEEHGWMVNMFSQDIGGENYYLTKVWINNTLISDTLTEYGVADNIGFEGQYFPGLSVYYLDDSKTDEVLKNLDRVTLELDGITKDYYDYVQGCMAEIRPKDPIFSGPSANVITNISPSRYAVGFFAAYSVERKTVVFRKG